MLLFHVFPHGYLQLLIRHDSVIVLSLCSILNQLCLLHIGPFFLVIPVLASLFGAVPFIGAYWACLPAVLELWLVQDQWFKAMLMLTLQLAPTSFVDCAIYSEIKGGGHPFLTGLAIAGGVFCLGFQGALFGPMLLCVLIVAMKVYRTVMHSMPLDSGSSAGGRRFSFKRMFTID